MGMKTVKGTKANKKKKGRGRGRGRGRAGKRAANKIQTNTVVPTWTTPL
jgi:hypothetical protein